MPYCANGVPFVDGRIEIDPRHSIEREWTYRNPSNGFVSKYYGMLIAIRGPFIVIRWEGGQVELPSTELSQGELDRLDATGQVPFEVMNWTRCWSWPEPVVGEKRKRGEGDVVESIEKADGGREEAVVEAKETVVEAKETDAEVKETVVECTGAKDGGSGEVECAESTGAADAADDGYKWTVQSQKVAVAHAKRAGRDNRKKSKLEEAGDQRARLDEANEQNGIASMDWAYVPDE